MTTMAVQPSFGAVKKAPHGCTTTRAWKNTKQHGTLNEWRTGQTESIQLLTGHTWQEKNGVRHKRTQITVHSPSTYKDPDSSALEKQQERCIKIEMTNNKRVGNKIIPASRVFYVEPITLSNGSIQLNLLPIASIGSGPICTDFTSTEMSPFNSKLHWGQRWLQIFMPTTYRRHTVEENGERVLTPSGKTRVAEFKSGLINIAKRAFANDKVIQVYRALSLTE